MKTGSVRRLAARLVLALWAASAASLIGSQALALFGPQRFHPEIPGEDPQAALAVLEGCRQNIAAGETLGIVYAEEDAVQHFLAFRLAYELYPRLVVSESYAEGDAAKAVARVRDRHPSRLLLLGAPDVDVAGATLVARLGPKAHLVRLAEGDR